MPATYEASFYPMHLGLLSVRDNLMPIAWWTPVSKDPFRILLAIDRANWSLDLLRETGEAALHFLPFADWERVMRAGFASGRRVDKAARLGFELAPAAVLRSTRVVAGAEAVYELAVVRELAEPAGDHVPFVCDVVHVEGKARKSEASPILFLGYRDTATLGERRRLELPDRRRRRRRRTPADPPAPGGEPDASNGE